MAEHHVDLQREVAVEERDHFLRAARLGQRGEAADVGEEQRHLAPRGLDAAALDQLLHDVRVDEAREHASSLPGAARRSRRYSASAGGGIERPGRGERREQRQQHQAADQRLLAAEQQRGDRGERRAGRRARRRRVRKARIEQQHQRDADAPPATTAARSASARPFFRFSIAVPRISAPGCRLSIGVTRRSCRPVAAVPMITILPVNSSAGRLRLPSG